MQGDRAHCCSWPQKLTSQLQFGANCQKPAGIWIGRKLHCREQHQGGITFLYFCPVWLSYIPCQLVQYSWKHCPFQQNMKPGSYKRFVATFYYSSSQATFCTDASCNCVVLAMPNPVNAAYPVQFPLLFNRLWCSSFSVLNCQVAVLCTVKLLSHPSQRWWYFTD